MQTFKEMHCFGPSRNFLATSYNVNNVKISPFGTLEAPYMYTVRVKFTVILIPRNLNCSPALSSIDVDRSVCVCVCVCVCVSGGIRFDMCDIKIVIRPRLSAAQNL